MNIKRKEHYVPVSYQKGFCNAEKEGMVYQLNTKENKIIDQLACIKDICKENNLYELRNLENTEEFEKRNYIETELFEKRVEKDLIKIINNLKLGLELSYKTICLPPKYFENIIIEIIFMMQRNPKKKDYIYKRNPNVEKFKCDYRFIMDLSLKQDAKTITDVLMNGEIFFLRRRGSIEFAYSDFPAVFLMYNDKITPKLIYMPLTKDFAVLILKRSFNIDSTPIIDLNDDWVTKTNKLLYYGSSKLIISGSYKTLEELSKEIKKEKDLNEKTRLVKKISKIKNK